MKSNNEWINISDLMSVLMMVFLFISVAYMYEVQKEQKSIELIATSYSNTNDNIHKSMKSKFGNKLNKWKAKITEENEIVFFSPEVLFKNGENNVTLEFQKILDIFFPQLISSLSADTIKKEIKEIRIQGHTDNTFGGKIEESNISYINNMYISQQRAFKVLKYCTNINNPLIKKNSQWLQKRLRAVGMSYSKPFKINDKIDWSKSKRVEFKIVTKSKDKLYKILKQLNKV